MDLGLYFMDLKQVLQAIHGNSPKILKSWWSAHFSIAFPVFRRCFLLPGHLRSLQDQGSDCVAVHRSTGEFMGQISPGFTSDWWFLWDLTWFNQEKWCFLWYFYGISPYMACKHDGSLVVWPRKPSNHTELEVRVSNGKKNGALGFQRNDYWEFTNNDNWLVVWNMNFMTFHILGMSSSQLINLFQRGRYTTSQIRVWRRMKRRRL